MRKSLILLGLISCLYGLSQSWVPVDLNTEKNLYDVHFLDTGNGWIVGEAGAVFRYYDNIWHEMDAGTNNTLVAVFMEDTNNVWLAGYGGIIIHYTSSGFQTSASPTTKNLNDIYMINDSLGWIVGDDGTLLVFNGYQWDYEYIELSPTFHDPNHLDSDNLHHIDFLDDNYGVITGSWGTYLEYDGTWHDRIWQNTQYFVSASIINTDLVLISGFESNPLAQTHYIFTLNPGREFLYFSNEGPFWINSFKTYGTRGWAVISNGNILKYNGGSFEKFDDLPVALNSLSYLDDSTGWIAGGGGTLLQFNPYPDVNLGDDMSFCEGTYLILGPGANFASYLWNTGEVTDQITVTEPGEYWVEVTNDLGFTGRDTINVTMIPKPGTPETISGPLTVDNFETSTSTYTVSETANTQYYQWKILPFEAGLIDGTGTSATVIWSAAYSGPAEISVRGINIVCEGDYVTGYQVSVYSSQGLPEVPNHEKLRILPNPTSGIFKIETDHIIDVQIYNASGRLVYTGYSSLNNISNFPDGIFFILVRTEKGVLAGKVLKQQ